MVSGAKALCNFRVKCRNNSICKEKCESVVDYSNPMKATVLIRGAADQEAQKRVLAAAGEDVSSSAEDRKIVEAIKTAKQSAEALGQGGGGLNKMTDQRSQRHDNSRKWMFWRFHNWARGGCRAPPY